MWVGNPQRADTPAVISINLRTAVRRRTVMLSAAKHLGPASEMLRCAQHDKRVLRMTSGGGSQGDKRALRMNLVADASLLAC